MPDNKKKKKRKVQRSYYKDSNNRLATKTITKKSGAKKVTSYEPDVPKEDHAMGSWGNIQEAVNAEAARRGLTTEWDYGKRPDNYIDNWEFKKQLRAEMDPNKSTHTAEDDFWGRQVSNVYPSELYLQYASPEMKARHIEEETGSWAKKGPKTSTSRYYPDGQLKSVNWFEGKGLNRILPSHGVRYNEDGTLKKKFNLGGVANQDDISKHMPEEESFFENELYRRGGYLKKYQRGGMATDPLIKQEYDEDVKMGGTGDGMAMMQNVSSMIGGGSDSGGGLGGLGGGSGGGMGGGVPWGTIGEGMETIGYGIQDSVEGGREMTKSETAIDSALGSAVKNDPTGIGKFFRGIAKLGMGAAEGIGGATGGTGGARIGSQVGAYLFEPYTIWTDLAEHGTLFYNPDSERPSGRSVHAYAKYGGDVSKFQFGGPTSKVYEAEGGEIMYGTMPNVYSGGSASQITDGVTKLNGRKHEGGGMIQRGGEKVLSDSLYLADPSKYDL